MQSRYFPFTHQLMEKLPPRFQFVQLSLSKKLSPKMKLSFIFKLALYLDRYSGTGATSSRFALLQVLSQDWSSHGLLGLDLELCSPSHR